MVHVSKQATRWLGVWLDSQLALKEHHDVGIKKARNAQNRLRRLAGKGGLSPENCRWVQAACVQAAALFGSEMWWKGDGARGTKNRQEYVQKVINQFVKLNHSTPWAPGSSAAILPTRLRTCYFPGDIKQANLLHF